MGYYQTKRREDYFDRDWDWEFFERAGISRERAERLMKSLSRGRASPGRVRRRKPHTAYKCVVCGRWYLECVSADGSRANVFPKKHRVLRDSPGKGPKVETKEICPGSYELAEWITVWEFTTGIDGLPYKRKAKWRKDRFKDNGEDG